jgi:hypothetical protein
MTLYELDEPGQLVARETARLVLDELKPGCGPMTVAPWAAEVFAEIAGRGGFRTQQPFPCIGPHYVAVLGEFRPDGSLYLALEVNSDYRVWEGVLRGPAGGP